MKFCNILSILLTVSLLTVSGCNSGSTSSSSSQSTSQLTSYPVSGDYIGYASSEKYNVLTTTSGTINESYGVFVIQLSNNSHGDITGIFQLNNNTCFVGNEILTFESKTTQPFDIALTNCSYSNNQGILTGDFKNEFGDYGTVELHIIKN